MADGDEVDVVLKDGEGGEEVKDKPAGKTNEEQLAELRADLDRERAARADAERRATAAGGEVERSAEQVRQSHLTTMGTAIEVLTQKKAQLRAARAAARAEGDEVRENDIEDALFETTIQLNEISKGKTLMEATPAQRRAPAPPSDVVEQVASGLTPKSAAWVRAHPEYARDTKLLNKMKAAHFEVVADIGEDKAETPEYFTAIEEKLGITGGRTVARNGDAAGEDGVNVTVTSDAAVPVQGRQQRDVQPSPAPANRGGGSTRTVRLTPEQQEAAKINHMTNEEYAARLVAEKTRGTTGTKH